MTKKLLSQLVAFSYEKNTLNSKNVNKIVSYLNRSDLKQYIKGLKMHEKKINVFIDVPTNDINDKDKFSKIFPNKKIVFGIDNSLMLGARILDNDMLYEINLKNTLNNIILHIEKDYD